MLDPAADIALAPGTDSLFCEGVFIRRAALEIL